MIIGYPVKFIYKKNEFFTLYFEDSDTLYKQNNVIRCYENIEEMIEFLSSSFIVDSSLAIYDFDNTTLINPIDYSDVLNKWNILNTIAKMYKMYFEGDSNKRTYTYDFLFKCVVSIEELPKYIYLSDKCIKDINKVFIKKDRFLNKLLK